MLRKWNVLSWLLVIIWMAVIFSLSAETSAQSDSLSMGITKKIVKLLEKVTGQTKVNIEDFNHIIRKCAHFSIYLVLGLLVMNAVRNTELPIRSKLILTILICIVYAASDEFHQIFVSGRGPQITDVLIDSCGACLGTGIYYGGWRKWRKRAGKLDKNL
ncbi:VanZ family protein [Neobacillus fumarioli]|uniref:VanZ family protein n=1 Tax=Neobacillus fumarioli TaxID=105229 RepID=UPI000835565F|nr:VanZ family protein [Neobacillus fumarioli]